MWDVIVSILRIIPIYLMGTYGELLSQKSGVYNIGIEGVMAFGAISGIMSYHFIIPDLWISLAVGFLGGAIFGLINSVLSINFKLDQVVVGFGLWFFGIGLAGFLSTSFLAGAPPNRIFDPIFLDLDPIFYLSIFLSLFFCIFFAKTSKGLMIRAVGENPRATDALGIDVDKVRRICVVIGCGIIGLAGTYLFMNFLQGFRTMVAGYGWICFALVMFARWKAPYVPAGASLFSAVGAIQLRLQVAGVEIIPTEFMSVLPHIAVIVVLTLTMTMGGKGAMPSSLGVPYKRGE